MKKRMDNKIYFVCPKYTVLLGTVCLGILLLYYTVNLYTTSQNETGFWCSPLSSASWLHIHYCYLQELPVFCQVVRRFHSWIGICRYSTVTVRLHAPIAEYHRVNSLPILCYFHFCMCMCVCLFFMKSLTHNFDYIDNFVTFCFYVGRSLITCKKQLQK